MTHGDFEQLVLHRLRQGARRLRASQALEGALAVVAVAVAVLAGQLLLDWWLRPPVDMRAALLAGAAAAAAVTAWRRVVAPLRVRFGPLEIAAAIERRQPELNALLVSAVQFSAGQIGPAASNSPRLAAAVVAQAAAAADGIDFAGLINRRRVRRSFAGLVGLMGVVAAALVLAPEVMGIWFERNILLADVSWPRRTRILVELPADGVLRGAFDDDLEVAARIADGYEVPRQVEIVSESRSGRVARATMTGVGERGFRCVFPRVSEDFRFKLIGGDDETAWYATRLTERPRMTTAVLSITPPAYTRLAPFSLPEGQRSADLYLGSRLAIRITCSKPVAEAVLYCGAERVGEAEADDGGFAVAVTPDQSRTYHFELTDADGMRSDRPARLSIRVVKDQAPRVRLQIPNVGNLVTAQAVLPVEAEFTDDLGLADAGLLYQLSREGGKPQRMALPGFAPPEREFQLHYEWAMADAGVVVGDQVAVLAEARDFDDVSGPNVGQSTTITFRVAEPEELLAEFARREQDYRRQFERVVDDQQRIRNELLTLLGQMGEASAPEGLEGRLAPLERRQRQVLGQVSVIRQQFQQILTEMRINQADDDATRQRLGDGVIQPLAELGTRDLPEAADLLQGLAREQTLEAARRVDPAQARVLGRMQRVLDNLVKWEGFQESVNMLRDILRMQRELNLETKEQIERQGQELFDK